MGSKAPQAVTHPKPEYGIPPAPRQYFTGTVSLPGDNFTSDRETGPDTLLSPKEAAISATRQSTYGAWEPNMVATSENMSGLYRQWQANNPNTPLPGWWAPLMQVAVKLNRIASGKYHADNFDDARVYLGFVEAMQRGEACGGTTSTSTVAVTTDTTPATGQDGAHE